MTVGEETWTWLLFCDKSVRTADPSVFETTNPTTIPLSARAIKTLPRGPTVQPWGSFSHTTALECSWQTTIHKVQTTFLLYIATLEQWTFQYYPH
jgi:hypothetical protein